MRALTTSLVLLSLIGVAPALGQAKLPGISGYSDLDFAECTIIHTDDFGSQFACPGYKGYPVLVAEGDLRFFISYGFGASDEKAASQTLPPFNTLGEKIEWRLSNDSGGFLPFATIVRYFVSREGKEDGQVLVVTRLEPGATCQVAYIDALENANANEMARKAADEKAKDFDCADEPETIGTFKAW